MTSITAQVLMKAEEEGGRHCPFWEGYRPHLVVTGQEELLGVIVVDLPESEAVVPGGSAQVGFTLVYETMVDYSALQPGAEFEIREGPRVVGSGIVLSRSHNK